MKTKKDILFIHKFLRKKAPSTTQQKSYVSPIFYVQTPEETKRTLKDYHKRREELLKELY